jgi:heme/copper-type cytochrome/quinol oxidase subunit 2
MRIDTLLSTIILVSFLVTIVMAVGSYAAYKLREARRPRAEPPRAGEESLFFERIGAGP